MFSLVIFGKIKLLLNGLSIFNDFIFIRSNMVKHLLKTDEIYIIYRKCQGII